MSNSSFYGSNPTPTPGPTTGTPANVYTGTYAIVRVAEFSGSSGTVVIDWSTCDHAKVTANGDITLSFIGAINGQKCLLEVIQDSTGGRTVTMPSSQIAYSAQLTSITLSTAANKRDKAGFIYNSATAKYELVATLSGF